MARERRDAAVEQTAAVQAATVDVAVSLADWTLAQAVAGDDNARAALGTALADGTAALASGAGDPDAVAALTEALADATAADGSPVDRSDLDAVLASTTALDAARTALESATHAVTG